MAHGASLRRLDDLPTVIRRRPIRRRTYGPVWMAASAVSAALFSTGVAAFFGVGAAACLVPRPPPLPEPVLPPLVEVYAYDPPPQAPPSPPPAHPSRLVLVVGDPDLAFFVDGLRLGPTNESYRIPDGTHTCGIGLVAPAIERPCVIDRTVQVLTLRSRRPTAP